MKAYTVGLSATHKKTLEPVWEAYGLEEVEHYSAEQVPPHLFQRGAEGLHTVLLFIDNSLNLEQLSHYRKMADSGKVLLIPTTHTLAHHRRSLCLQGFYPLEDGPQVEDTRARDKLLRVLDLISEQPEIVQSEVEQTSPQEEEPMSEKLSLIPKAGQETTELDYDGVVGLLKDAIRILRDQYGVERIQWAKMATLTIDRVTKDSHPI